MEKFKPISQEENNLAYELNHRLVDAVERFRKEHPRMSINVVFGAANVFMADGSQMPLQVEVLGFTLQEVAEYNIHKLASRQQRGVIEGDGDNR